MGVNGQLNVPAALPPGKEPLVPTGEEAVWASEPSWTLWWSEKFPAFSGTRTTDHPARSPALYHSAIPGARISAGAENFSLHHRVQTGFGAHPTSCPVGTSDSFPGVKRPGREADHSLPSSADIKIAWRYTSTIPYVMVWFLVKLRDNFTLLYWSFRFRPPKRCVSKVLHVLQAEE
jgi:hypothetical protein